MEILKNSRETRSYESKGSGKVVPLSIQEIDRIIELEEETRRKLRHEIYRLNSKIETLEYKNKSLKIILTITFIIIVFLIYYFLKIV